MPFQVVPPADKLSAFLAGVFVFIERNAVLFGPEFVGGLEVATHVSLFCHSSATDVGSRADDRSEVCSEVLPISALASTNRAVSLRYFSLVREG